MTVVQELKAVQAVLGVVVSDLGQADGTVSFKDGATDLKFAADVEAALKSAGVSIPPDVDKILAGAQALASILGLK